MNEMDFITAISNFGFPIAITIYLLVTRDNIIAENTKALNNLSLIIENLKK